MFTALDDRRDDQARADENIEDPQNSAYVRRTTLLARKLAITVGARTRRNGDCRLRAEANPGPAAPTLG